jgi:hypothetical protein
MFHIRVFDSMFPCIAPGRLRAGLVGQRLLAAFGGIGGSGK